MKSGETVFFRFNSNGAVHPQSIEIAEINLRKGKGVILLMDPPEEAGVEIEPARKQTEEKSDNDEK